MSMKDLLGKLARIDESMKSDAKKPTGPKFPGYWKGTDKASQAKNKMVGGSAEESIIKDLEKALTESPKRNIAEEYKRYASEWCQVCGQSPCNCTTVAEGEVIPFPKREVKPQEKKPEPKKDNVKAISKDRYAKTAHNTMQGPSMASIYETFNSKQEVIAHFVKQGKSAAAGAAAWERGWRGPKPQAKPTKTPQAGQKFWWQDKEELEEYGGVGGYGAASQAPSGTTATNPDPAQQQMKLDQAQIQKSTNNLASTLNQQGAAQPLNKTKFSDILTKLDAKPNTNLSAQELQQMGPMAVAASKALQNPQTAGQMKQLISKADTLDKQKELKVQQAQQKTGTNTPANQQSTTTTPTSAGQTK